MTNKAWARVARFSRDIRGNFTMTFAIAAPCLLLGVAAAVTYANSVSYKQKLQAAADSAALAATTALTNGQSAAQAQTVATNLFASNAPGYDGSVVPTVSASVSNNNATTTISYQAPALNTPLSSLLGGAPAPHVSATAVGPISYASSKTTFAGTGGIYGDPHLNGALGGSNIFQCQTNNAWYNALSDAGIEVNFSCYYSSYWNEEGVSGFTILLGSHIISTTATPPTFSYDANNNVVINYNGQPWYGDLVIDGVDYPPMIGNYSYLNGQVTTSITNVSNPGQGGDSIVINYANGPVAYTITMSFDSWQMGAITVTATNAGLCGVPGGIFGQTLAGLDDLNAQDFSVASSISTTPPFNWTTCIPANMNSVAHLVQ